MTGNVNLNDLSFGLRQTFTNMLWDISCLIITITISSKSALTLLFFTNHCVGL